MILSVRYVNTVQLILNRFHRNHLNKCCKNVIEQMFDMRYNRIV